MTADVQERAQRVLAIANEHDGDVADARGRERSRLGDVAGVADVLPRAAEDALALELEHGGVRVPAPRQASDVDGAHGANATRGHLKRWVASRRDEHSFERFKEGLRVVRLIEPTAA